MAAVSHHAPCGRRLANGEVAVGDGVSAPTLSIKRQSAVRALLSSWSIPSLASGGGIARRES